MARFMVRYFEYDATNGEYIYRDCDKCGDIVEVNSYREIIEILDNRLSITAKELEKEGYECVDLVALDQPAILCTNSKELIIGYDIEEIKN